MLKTRKGRDKIYSNSELAEKYREVIGQNKYGSVFGIHGPQMRRIERAPVDLHRFYLEHGSFDDLNVRRIGTQTKEILRLIIDDGVEKAKERARRVGVADSLRPSRVDGPEDTFDVPTEFDLRRELD